ncbi:Histone-Lysine N-Methyltransferase ash1l, partial [Podila epigama]
CSPNSQIEKWLLNGEMSIGIFAAQDIPAGAEISYDYNFSPFSGAQKQRCRCESANCRGYIGERGSKSKAVTSSDTTPEPTKGRKGKGGRKRKANKRTPQRGFGIQTTKPIAKGSLVIEYRGEVISQSLCHERMSTIYKNNKNFYFLEYEKGEVVDACQKGTKARFVNH